MKKLIIVCGSPAAGKTTYAKKLAAKLSATLVDIDSCTEILIQVALGAAGKDPDDRDSAYFKELYRAAIYNTLFAIAGDNIRHSDVIIAGPFTKEILDPAWPDQLSQTFQVTPEIHYVSCDSDLRQQRMELRSNPRDRSKLEDWEKTKAYYGEERGPVFKHTLINSGDSKSA